MPRSRKHKYCSDECRADGRWDGKLSLRYKKLLMERANGKCEDCGSTERLETHHLWPRALGGSHDLDNMRLLCFDCHRGSGYERSHAHLIDAGLLIPRVGVQLSLAA